MLGHAPYERPELVFASDTTGTLSFCLRDSALSFKKDCLAPSAPAKAGFSRVPSVFSPARIGLLRVSLLRRIASLRPLFLKASKGEIQLSVAG